MKVTNYSDLKNLEDLARYLTNQCKKTSCNVILLKGELGVGKTTITQKIALQLGVESRVNSPTFTITKKHSTKDNIFLNLYHYDLYRLSSSRETEELGIYEEIGNKNNLVIIEWPELITENLKRYLLVKLSSNKKKRVAKIFTR